MNQYSPFQRFPITVAEIERLVAAFYAEIRVHPTLGPIFLRAVGTGHAAWEAHEAKIASFWRNAILIDRDYRGNPMRVHLQNPEIRPDHFVEWLALFDRVARRELPPDRAEAISRLAQRIGKGLAYGIEHFGNAPAPASGQT